jgi:hypothetical protein
VLLIASGIAFLTAASRANQIEFESDSTRDEGPGTGRGSPFLELHNPVSRSFVSVRDRLD